MATWADRDERPQPRRFYVRAMDGPAPDGAVRSTDFYSELFWLPVIGPASLLLHRRLTHTCGRTVTDEYLAAAIGLGHPGRGRWSAFRRTLERLEQFGWIRQEPDGATLSVRVALPRLTARDERKLPAELRTAHEHMTRPTNT